MPLLGPMPTWSFALGVTTSLFSVLNPISAAVVFAAATANMERPALRRSARKAALTAGAAMLAFALVGQFIFSFFGFTALAMRFVGGVLVLYRAISMLYGEDPRERHTEDEKAEAGRKLPDDFAIIPFGIPLLAGPGTLSTVMGMIAGVSWLEYGVVLIAILLNTWATYLFLRNAPAVFARLGAIGTKVVNKLMGLILAAVAMQFLINGVKALTIEIRQMPPAAIVSTK
ncbi:MAG TPA: MarC family protein [Geothrix sp.]|nr:MarC family protein [Geothrix sp.]